MVSAFLSSIFIFASDNESQIIPPETDFLFCGKSNCERGFIPDLIDEELGTYSYNLSITGLKNKGKYELLKNVLPNYPIKKVVLEVSYSSFFSGDLLQGISPSDMRLQRYLGNYIGIDYYILKEKVM